MLKYLALALVVAALVAFAQGGDRSADEAAIRAVIWPERETSSHFSSTGIRRNAPSAGSPKPSSAFDSPPSPVM